MTSEDKARDRRIKKLHKIMSKNAHRLDELMNDEDFMQLFSDCVDDGMMKEFEDLMENMADVKDLSLGDTNVFQVDSTPREPLSPLRTDFMEKLTELSPVGAVMPIPRRD